MQISIFPDKSRAQSHGRGNGHKFSCVLGRTGVTGNKIEGDSATPIGVLRPIYILYRAGKVHLPRTPLTKYPIRRKDGWCDAPQDRQYNRPIRHPFRARGERLWRKDHLYDLVVVTDYNDHPVKKGKGSAIFLHLCHHDFLPTEGCIALRLRDLKRLVCRLTGKSRFIVHDLPGRSSQMAGRVVRTSWRLCESNLRQI